MARLSALLRRTPASPATPLPGTELPHDLRIRLPLRFEAVGEALWLADSPEADVLGAADVVGTCSVVGRDIALDGASLGEALSALRTTYDLVRGTEPGFEATEALSTAWSEATLAYLHDLSCEDPLTGLASLAHVRTRLDELYREAELTDTGVAGSHALVIVEVTFRRAVLGVPGHHFTRAMRLVQVAQSLRAVFSGGQTLGRLGLDRAVAVVPRSVDLGLSVALLREFLDELDLPDADLRVWIEGLPASSESARLLLDDLAR